MGHAGQNNRQQSSAKLGAWIMDHGIWAMMSAGRAFCILTLRKGQHHHNIDQLIILLMSTPQLDPRMVMIVMVMMAGAVPGEVVDSALGGIVASDGGDGHDGIDGGHIDDRASTPRRHLVLLYHLSSSCLARLQATDICIHLTCS